MAASSTNKKKRRKKESLEHKARRIGVALAVFFAVLAADELGLSPASLAPQARCTQALCCSSSPTS